MTREEAIDILQEDIAINKHLIDTLPSTAAETFKNDILAYNIAIKSLEAWEIIKDNLSQQIHYNLDVKENFEIGSTSRIECNTTASVLAGVIYLIDRHLSEVENEIRLGD